MLQIGSMQNLMIYACLCASSLEMRDIREDNLKSIINLQNIIEHKHFRGMALACVIICAIVYSKHM